MSIMLYFLYNRSCGIFITVYLLCYIMVNKFYVIALAVYVRIYIFCPCVLYYMVDNVFLESASEAN